MKTYIVSFKTLGSPGGRVQVESKDTISAIWVALELKPEIRNAEEVKIEEVI